MSSFSGHSEKLSDNFKKNRLCIGGIFNCCWREDELSFLLFKNDA